MSKNPRFWPILGFRHSREKASTDADPAELITSHGHDTRSESPDDHLQISGSRRHRSKSWLRISNRNKNKDAETKPTKFDQAGANTQPYLSQTEDKDEPGTCEGKVSGSAGSVRSAQGTPIKGEGEGQDDTNIARLGEKVMKDLWSEAYKKLHNDNSSLIESYEKVLLATETDQMVGRSPTKQEETDRQKRIQNLVFCRLQDMEQGQFNIPRRSRQGVIGDYVRRTVHGILFAKDFVTAAISVEPHAALAWAGVVMVLPIRLTKQLSRSGLFQYMRDIATADDWKEMLTEIKHTDKSIEDILGDWSKKTVQEIHAELTSMKREVERQLNIILDTTNTQAAQDQLNTLHPVTRAAFGSYEQARETCLVGTQVPLLQLIQDWSNDAQAEPILWLQGMAGTGKSTIARTVASAFYNGTSLLGQETLPNEACLGGSFFFDHRDEDCKNPRKLFPTLARDLVDVLPEIQQSLCDGIRSHHATHARSLDSQWKHLIFNPLKMLKTRLPVTILFVLDALDECQAGTREDQNDISDILALLSQVRELTTVRVRVLITSRPGIHMRHRFNEIPEGIRDETVYKIRRLDDDGVRADDITRLIEYRLWEVRRKHDLPRDWPGKERVEKLAEKADGLFIYAATVCRFLSMANRKTIEDRLGRIFDGDVGKTAKESLDEMYTRVLQVVLTGEVDNDQAMSDLFKQVVGSILVLSRPLSIIALSRLVEVELSDTRWLMEHLYSVLEMPQGDQGPIQLLHLSFRDFLLASQRCKDNHFWVDEKQAHHILYQYCLKVMSNTLRRDICCLEDPSTHVTDIKPSAVHGSLPEQVQYACSHWVDHLQQSDIVASNDIALYDFLRTHFVHWLEAMAIMGRIPIAIMILNNLTALQLDTNAKMRRLVQDARRFAVSFRSVYEKAPLQIYASSLLFAPQESIIRLELWDCAAKVLHSYINTDNKPLVMGFSPDSKNTISLSKNGQVNVWDRSTNEFRSNIHHISDSGNSDPYCGMASFPRFGELAASSVGDGPKEIWTLIPGVLAEVFRFSSRMLDALAFSPDGEIIAASGCWAEEITIWNGSSKVSEVLDNVHQDTITDLGFTSNGTVVASTSKDGTVRLWEARSGRHMKSLQVVDDPGVRSIRFSADGQTMICRTYDEQCVIWDVPTGKVLKNLELGKDTSKLQNMAISHDGQLVATGCFDERKDTSHVELWNLTLTEPLLTFTEEGDTKDNEISPRGTFIASTYYGSSTFQLRHTRTGNLIHSLDHGDRGPVIAFSPSENMIASAEHSIKLWNTSTGTCLGQRSIEGRVEFMVFSGDGTCLRTNEGFVHVLLETVLP
ncbi:WD40-repeat-containing domain protein [Aspergillus sergii]|uniref:WD40-repeat-containing domain protein n=1 Tax=Aspergillus sergii TaxID=1034303 RepID=A0A5N6X1T8_9EURO|nr:WD40-repeat-containing domain protein [Aspergillus sergii]